jgi:hypothetical protein
MTPDVTRPVNPPAVRTLLQIVVDEAVAATGADQGWLVVVDGDAAAVAATSDGLTHRVGEAVVTAGPRGFALASGQVSVLLPAPSDTAAAGTAGWEGVPPSLLVAPVSDAGVLLEVAGKRGGGGFTFDDIEAATSYANIAASAVAEHGDRPEVPTPAELGAGLSALAAADATRYRQVAALVETMLTAAR